VDQADKLRRIVSSLRERSEVIIDRAVKKTGKKARLIAVTSGKGGVGKTSLTVNIAIKLSKNGYRVVVIDGDLGLANVEVMLGIVPQYSMYDIINSGLSLSDVIIDGPMGIKFISGGTGVVEMAYLDRRRFDSLLDTLSVLDSYADFILVDTGAGISRSVTKFVLAAREVILVTNSEPTSITDAYAILKIISIHNKECYIKMIANMVESPAEAEDILARINTAAKMFIGAEIKSLGFVKRDPAVSKAVKTQTPFIIGSPKSAAAKSIERIAQRIVYNTEYIREPEGVREFLTRIYLRMNSS
jgi:flagellar biosynthesis protein FlhG